MRKDHRPIIIVKKVRKGGHAHHGGSWKVAYADFVTAMMAFFMVMWLVSLDDETRRHIEQYFSHPVGYHQGSSSGDSPIATGPSPAAAGDVQFRLIARSGEQRMLEETAGRIRSRFDSMATASLAQLAVEVTVGEDGLRIELLESGSGETYFPRSSATPQRAALTALRLIGLELGRLQNAVILEGHTDAVPYARGATYTNWELSSDRANAARRVLEASGVSSFRLREVRALGASRLRNADQPTAPENRRISIILPFNTVLEDSDTAATGGRRPGVTGIVTAG
jgi:chemotaxis protein MotB